MSAEKARIGTGLIRAFEVPADRLRERGAGGERGLRQIINGRILVDQPEPVLGDEADSPLAVGVKDLDQSHRISWASRASWGASLGDRKFAHPAGKNIGRRLGMAGTNPIDR